MSRRKKLILLIVAAVIIVIMAVFYYLVDPEKATYAPKCLIHEVTGLRCPSCGMQRFLHHMAHGEVATALRYNYMLVVFLPYVLAALVAEVAYCTRRYHDKAVKALGVLYSSKVLIAYLAIYAIWFIVRNIYGL